MGNPFAMDPAPTAQPTTQPPAAAANPFGSPAAPAAASAPAAPVAPAAPFGSTVPAAGEDPFAGPAPQEARGPRLREMYGRLLLIVPRKLERGITSQFKSNDGSAVIQDRMTADVVVLTGDPSTGLMAIEYGGKPEAMPPVPHTKRDVIPAMWRGMYISAEGLISQCREALAKTLAGGRPGMVLGRLTKGQDTGKGNPPWILAEATEADKALARQYLSSVDPLA